MNAPIQTKPNRATELAAALRSASFDATADHDVVTLAAPEHTGARVFVGRDIGGYLCSFVALPEHTDKDARAWAEWTATVRQSVEAVWPELVTYAAPEPRPAPVLVFETRYDHAYPQHVLVDDALAHPYQVASREGRFTVVQAWRAWGARNSDGYEAPRMTWHEWAADVAAKHGAARGWATLEGQPLAADHPAVEHVRRLLCEAAKHVEPPAGIVALDLRGLPLSIVEPLVKALIEAANDRGQADGWTRGGVLLCDPLAALFLGRGLLQT